MIFSSPPPQFGQVCMSMSNTRLSSRAQLMRPERNWMGSASHAVATTASLAARGAKAAAPRLPDRPLQGGEIGAANVEDRGMPARRAALSIE
jgi:hypothetical protein